MNQDMNQDTNNEPEYDASLYDVYNIDEIDKNHKITLSQFIKHYKRMGCNAAATCRDLQVPYSTYIKFHTKNPKAFDLAKQEVRDLEDSFAYSKLMQLIAKGNTAAIIFFAKSRLGMHETSEVKLNTPDIDVEAAVRELKEQLC